MTARDIHYGRRGGRWAEADTGRLANELAAAREAAEDWPDSAADSWRPQSREDWEGRARMAAAKADAGGALDALDVEALARIPEPPSCFAGGPFPRGRL